MSRANTVAPWRSFLVPPEKFSSTPIHINAMAATGNRYAELERLGGLEPFATHREILDQLQEAGGNNRDERQRAAVQLPRAKIGRFSQEELDGLHSEGWTLVAPRTRTRPSSFSIGDATTYNSVDAVIPRSLPTGVPSRQTTHTTLRTEKRLWKLLRWGSLGVLGAVAIAKLASRR